MNKKKDALDYSKKTWATFLIPSIIGIIVFLIPIPYEGETNIVLGVLTNWINNLFGATWPAILVGVIALSAILAILNNTGKITFKRKITKNVFDVSVFTIIIRVLSAILGIIILIEAGPEVLWHGDTGGLMLYLVEILAGFFLFAGFLLPFLTDFGLMEFVGALIRPALRPLFKIPGRASIDMLASWLGSAPVGVLVTDLQYTDGYYTAKEAVTISTLFSVVSLPIVFVFSEFLDMAGMFTVFYGSIVIVAIIANFIMVRIPPISKKEETYFPESGGKIHEERPAEMGLIYFGLLQSLNKAKGELNPSKVFEKGLGLVLDLWFALLPIVLLLGTAVLIVSEFTPVFEYISYPFRLYLELLRIPDAIEAAPALVVGFGDIFLPFVLGQDIPSTLTRFIVGVTAINQLIYMTEVGVVLLKLDIPVDFKDLVIIFIQKTIICVPLAYIIGLLLGL